MKKLLPLFLFLLCLNIVYACEEYEIYGLFENDRISCNQLKGVRIKDECDVFPLGDCWKDYENAEIILPDGINIFSDEMIELEESQIDMDWDLLECTQPGTYDIKVIFDDGACEKTLTLDLTQEYQEPVSGSSSGETGGSDNSNDQSSSSSNNEIIEEPDVIVTPQDIEEGVVEEVIVERRAEPTKTVIEPMIEKESNNLLLILLIILVLILGILLIGYIILKKRNQEFY
jgi:hypothetical protein|tara:strand:+ start:86 stop:775 length:690 start_codon:yes stop_codon:yes gene_type:complete